MSAEPILSVKGLCVSRESKSAKKRILNGISFDLEEGEIIDILGPSGCGKSTLLAAIAYMIPIDEGKIYFAGQPQEDFHPPKWRSVVSLLMQKPVVVNGSVKDNLLLPWTLKLRKNSPPPFDEELREYLDAINLSRIPLNRSALELSVGEQSRISLLRTLITKPKVLLLDEPEASLDKDTAETMLELLKDYLAKSRSGIIRVQHHHWDNVAKKRIVLNYSGTVEEKALDG